MTRAATIAGVLCLGISLSAIADPQPTLSREYDTQFSVDFASDLTTVFSEQWISYDCREGERLPWVTFGDHNPHHSPVDPDVSVAPCGTGLCVTGILFEYEDCADCEFNTGIVSPLIDCAGSFETTCAVRIDSPLKEVEVTLGCQLVADNDHRFHARLNLAGDWCRLERGRSTHSVHEVEWDVVGGVQIGPGIDWGTRELRLAYDAEANLIRGSVDGNVVGSTDLAEWSDLPVESMCLDLFVVTRRGEAASVDVRVLGMAVGFNTQ